MNKQAVYSIVHKEIQSHLHSATSYLIIVVFVVLWQFLFFRNAFLVGEATLREMFGLVPWLFMIFVPAITMASIAQEKTAGTLEFLLTRPVNNRELLAGKYIASLIFATLGLLFTLPIAIGFSQFGQFDWGVYAGQLIGSIAVASVFVSLGIFVSSLVNSQIAALLLSVAMSFVLVIGGSEFVTGSLPQTVGLILEQLSVTTHFNSTIRGVLDVSNIWYYLSVSAVFMGLAYLQLLRRQFGNKKQEFRKYQTGMLLFVVIVVLSNILGTRIPGRIDLTQERLFTLTDATKNTLTSLQDVINVTVYRSEELPAQFQPKLREVADMLRDYATTSNNNVIVTYKDPADDPQIAQEAASLGIQQMQFNVIGDEELQLKNGYLGLAVDYAGVNEVIPFIENTAGLEYQLTSFIKKLTTADKKKVGFLAGHGEKTTENEYQYLGLELENQYILETVTLDEKNTTIPDDIDVLVIAGTTGTYTETQLQTILSYAEAGNALFVLYDALQANTQTLTADPNQSNAVDILKEYGIEVTPGIVYDLRSNETVNFGGGMFSVLLPYPFWVVAQATPGSSTISSRIDQIMLPWTNPLSLDDSKIAGNGLTSEVLLSTTSSGGYQSDSVNLSPEQTFSQSDLKVLPLAVGLTGGQSSSTEVLRMIVVGDSDFLSNNYVQNSPQNLAFGMEAISWLAQEDSLAEIQVKQKVERKLVFEDATQQTLIRYGSMALGVLVPLALGVFIMQRRRALRNMQYPKSTGHVK